MCSEHRPHLESSEDLGQHIGLHARLEDAVDGRGQAKLGDGQLVDPMDLLGDVGQVEIGRERPDQGDHLVDFQIGEPVVELARGLCATTPTG